MNPIKVFKHLTGVILLGGLASAGAADLEETISQLTGEASKQYVGPISSGFGSNLNAGWYHKAPPAKKLGFSLEAGSVFMGTFLSGGAKTLDVVGTFRFDQDQAGDLLSNVDTSGMAGYGQQVLDTLKVRLSQHDNVVRFFGPTVIGSDKDSMRIAMATSQFATGLTAPGAPDSVEVPGDTLVLPVTGVLHDFLDIPLPLFAPQISIGTIFGTNLTFRYLPTMEIPDIGEFNFFGFGIQHNPAVWMGKSLPVDICIGYFRQSLEVGSLFEASTNAYGLDVSKTLGWRWLNLTPYGGFQYETSNFKFHYDRTYQDPFGATQTLNVAYELDGENKTRFTAGLSIRVLVLNVNADYNFGKYNSLSAGVMLAL